MNSKKDENTKVVHHTEGCLERNIFLFVRIYANIYIELDIYL